MRSREEDVNLEDRSMSGKGKKDLGFSWNLTLDPLMLEDSIPLSHGFNVSGNSLQEIKDKVNSGIADILDERFKKEGEYKEDQEHIESKDGTKGDAIDALKLLKQRTQKQIKINYKEYSLYDKKLNKYRKRRREIMSRTPETQYTDELSKLFIEESQIQAKQKEINESQINLDMQSRLLSILDANDENRGLMLGSCFGQSPRINLLVGGEEYEICKGKKCDVEDVNSMIRETIKKKYEVINGKTKDDLSDYVDFVLRVCLAPFKVGGEYEEETMQYYIYDIIRCIKDTDIMKKINLQYELLRDEKGRLDTLDEDLQCIKDVVDEIIGKSKIQDSERVVESNAVYDEQIEQEHVEEEAENLLEETEEKTIEKEIKEDVGEGVKVHEYDGEFVGDNLSKLKVWSFIKYLERLGNDFGGYYDEIIEAYIKRFNGKTEENFDDPVKLGEFSIMSDLNGDISEDLFLRKSEMILEFLGKRLDQKKRVQLKDLFVEMSKRCRGKQVEDLGAKGVLEILLNKLNFEKKGNELIGNIKGEQITIDWVAWKNVLSKSRDELRKLPKNKGVYAEIKDFEKKYFPDIRVDDINLVFKEIFGIEVTHVNDTRNKTNSKLLEYMFKGLAMKVKSLRDKRVDDVNDNINEVKKTRLQGTQVEKSISEEIKLRLKIVIDDQLENCFESIEEGGFIDSIQGVQKSINELKQKLENCVDSDELLELGKKINELEEFCDEIKRGVESIYETYKWYKKLKEGKCDKAVTGGKFDSVKIMVDLKNLFECDELSLEDKFYYCSKLLGHHVIEAKSLGHEEILENIGVKEAKKDSLEKLGEVEGIISEITGKGEIDKIYSMFGKDTLVFKTYLQDKLEGKSSIYEVYEVIALALLKVEIYNKSDVKSSFKLVLQKLGIKDDKIKEIDKLDEMFPGALKLYIETSLFNGAFVSERCPQTAINYKSGDIDFSVIEAGIFEAAVDKGRNQEVLEYLGFFVRDKLEIPSSVGGNKNVLENTLKCIIEYFRENKLGCFSDGYRTKESDPYSWHKLDFQKENSYVRVKGSPYRFGIGKHNDAFRLVGIRIGGLYLIMECFDGHDKEYEAYLNSNNKIKEEEKTVFHDVTGCYWDEAQKKRTRGKKRE